MNPVGRMIPGGNSYLNSLKTHCKYGHEFTPENTIHKKGGGRNCLQCKRTYYMRSEKCRASIRRKGVEIHGITESQRGLLVDNQMGLCGICGSTLDLVTPRKAVIDHCHETKDVRGILCFHCNLIEGHLKRIGIDAHAFADALGKYLASPPAFRVLRAKSNAA